MDSPNSSNRMSRYSYTSTASLTPSNVELWICDDLDCNPPYGPLCAACRPKVAELQEARGDNESVASYRPDSPAVTRPKRSKDNLFEPDVYLDEVEEEDDANKLLEYLEQGTDELTISEVDLVRRAARASVGLKRSSEKLTISEVEPVQENARASVGLRDSVEKSRHYLRHHRWSVSHFGNKLMKERQAVAEESLPQQPQTGKSQTTSWLQPREEVVKPQQYGRIPQTDASKAATQSLYEGQQQGSPIVEDKYHTPFSSLIQEEEDEDETVTETRHRGRLHKWLHGLHEGPFAEEEFDDASSTRTSLYGPLARFEYAGPLTRFEEHAESRPHTAVPEPARDQIDERVTCKSCKRSYATYPDPPELHLMKCEYAYQEAARLKACGERQRENRLKDRNRSLNREDFERFFEI
jgi:hypothetical protein